MTSDRDELPIPDFDHVQLGSLPSAISALDVEGVQQLLEWERAHGDRLPVTEVLEQRIGALQSGATPSESTAQERPATAAPDAGSAVSPATAGPHVNPPSHGVMGETAR